MAVLDALGIEYEPQRVIGKYVVDMFVPSRRLVIECDGSYWHSRPGASVRDAERDEYMRSVGYAVLRLPQADIESGVARDSIVATFSLREVI